MREMRSSRRTEVSLKSSSQQLPDHNIGTDLTSAWKSLAQSKAALRHIENRIEATPGTAVLLDSVIDLPKKKSSRTVHCKDGQQVDDLRGSSKSRSRSHQSPEKSSSRSPLRNTTHNRNVRSSNSVEFREPLASYREATPPPHPSSQFEAYSLQSVPGSSHPSSPPPSESLPSQLVYQRDNRDKQTDRDLDSTHSSALESTEVRYLNDQPVLDTLRTEESTPKAQLGMDSQDTSPHIAATPGSLRRGESTPSTSPGSVSQRLENLRRHQPDDKLEKLKERIRRQRQHLEGAAEKEKLLGYLEQPIMAFVESNNAATSNMPTAKIRKVAAAPPAPMYKGFNSIETKIRTPDGKVWKEDEFHNLSREIYRDLSRQFAETTKSKHQQQAEQRADRSKERRPSKPVRKVHRAAPVSDLNAKAAISPASWRKGQKLVKMVLGPHPKLPREEDHPSSDGRMNQTAARHHSDTHSESKRRSRSHSTERPHVGLQGQSKSHSTTTSIPLSAAQGKAPRGASTDLLSADIQGILDDLQLECSAAEKEDRARKRSRGGSSGRRGGSGSRTRTPVSMWGTTVAPNSYSRVSRSASPTTHRPETVNMTEKGHKKRHYDADTVRQYIARQQEERKKRLAEEKRAMKEEAEKRNQRLQELYRKQREVARTTGLPMDGPVAPVQKRLQETYTKLLLEEAQQDKDATQAHNATSSTQMRPMYQPSGESDKENKRQEVPQSPSSSDRSLNDQPPPMLSRNELDVGVASLLQPDHLCPPVRPTTSLNYSLQASTNEHLLSQLLRLERTMAASDTLRAATAVSYKSQSKMSRIEALKAKAASLSTRIESEARKLAGEGINCGAATSVDVDTILVPRPSDVDCWRETPVRATENNDMSQRMRILSSTGHSSYNGTPLPGAGNLQSLREQKEKNDTHAHCLKPHTTSADRMERRKLVNGLEKEGRLDKVAQRVQYEKEENQADLHDSSAGSISEGPLLSEGSFSEDEASPPHLSNSHAQKKSDYQRLSEFQREATMCPALNSTFAQHDSSKAPWEELDKGSPLSVINIFTRNLNSHIKVSEGTSERNSPAAHSLHSGNAPNEAAVYEDDFVSSHSSKASGQSKRGPGSPSMNSHFEELTRRSPCEKITGGTYSQYSSLHSSIHSPHLSSGSASGSSPLSRHSSRRRGTASDQSDATLVEEQRNSCSPPSEALSSDSRKRDSDKSSPHSQAKSVHSNDTSGHSHQRPRLASPFASADPGSPPGAHSFSEPVKSGSLGTHYPNKVTSAREERSGRAETRPTGELQYSPAVLQQRMAAELQYLDSIEESVRQLGDVERLMSVSMAQQESTSLAQMLKAKQQRHERELYELKIKAEREALEAQLQLEENRQRVARAHIELQESLAATQRETLEGLQESTTKMMSQQAEAARYTVDAAQHIKEMTELVRSQMAGTSIVPLVAIDSSKQKGRNSSYILQTQDKAETDSFQSEVSSRRSRSEEPMSSPNSLSHSDSLRLRRLNLSGADSSSHTSPSHVSSDHYKRTKKEPREGKDRNEGGKERPQKDVTSSSIEEEVPAAVSDSLYSDNLPPVVDEKGETTSVATEYSLKFDESMTEDEIEERSFRSLLPSEAHRRGTMEKSRHHEESEDDGNNHNSTLFSASRSLNTVKSQDANIAFSGGQDSFSQFTMDMVRQYMKDEEVRLQHQSSLLRLRQKALKEKARMELAWLEHQKKRLRDKGEDDKMPPIRKKQRGLLLKLQQEQAEIKRLQEANKSARKERQLLLKQQEEIERMRNSTLRLKERLKCAGVEAPPETPVSEPAGSGTASPSMRHPGDIRSPSPSLSISGSETSSIMQKLKKMRSHMDEKFLTKREQQLMQRRHHAEELLQWKQRLDQEEAEVRRMEKEALAVWDQKTSQDKDLEMIQSQEKDVSSISSHPSHRGSEPRSDSEKDYVSEGDISSVTPESSIHTEGPGTEQPGSPSPAQLAFIPETPLASVQSSPANYTQDFTSESHSPSGHQSSSLKGSHSPAASLSDGSNKTKMHLRSTSKTPTQAYTQPTDPPMAAQTETISDQSDIESRIKALKEELKKRKFMAYQLKKEQKKRHKERLKAQEASLLKQLENYNDLIEKTKAELNHEPDSAPDTNSQIKESILEQSSIQPLPRRSETSNISDFKKIQIAPSLDHNAVPQSDHNRSTSVPEDLSDEEPSTVTPTLARHHSPESPTPGQRGQQSTESFSRPPSKEGKAESGDDNILSDCRSNIQEEMEVEVSSKFKDEHSLHLFDLIKGDKLDSLEKLSTSKYASSSLNEEHQHSPSVSLEQDAQLKQREISEVAEDSQPPSPAVDVKTFPQPKYSFHSPESFASASNKEGLIKESEASPTADGYHDDFESSVDSSHGEEDHNSKSHNSLSPTDIIGSRKDSCSRSTIYDSQDEVVEEEIAEELSHHSGVNESSHQSERLFDLCKQTEDLKHDKSVSHSPPISPVQTALSPVPDEMPDFNIGDRVLVGSVQPGTLRFKGPTSFANGFWAGVELDKSEGSNNGTYDGVVYFECNECHGIFAPPDKITHLPDKFEVYTDTTEDEDSFFDDLADKGGEKQRDNWSQKQARQEGKTEQQSQKDSGSGDNKVMDESGHKSQTTLKSHINSLHHKEHLISNGSTMDIMLELEDAAHTLLSSDVDTKHLVKDTRENITALVEREDEYPHTPVDLLQDEKRAQKDGNVLDTFADKLLNSFVKDTVKQFGEIKRVKEQKIEAANHMNGDLFRDRTEEEEWLTSVEQKDGLPFFLPAEKEELSSPELCNRPESPVLGASGQEELAKRLAELELSRELLDELGDDQDWFDEDFGLSSRREQQRLKQKEEEERLGGGLGRSGSSAATPKGGMVSPSGGEQHVKTPPRPELPLPLPPKLPELPAMVVPHTATEVEKMVHAATQEIWNSCDLGKEGTVSLAQMPFPQPSLVYLGKEASGQDQEALSIRSYRKAVYHLTWEILQEIYAEEPNTDQPQWVKPRRVKSSSFHRVKTPGDITKIQEFIAGEVLKLYRLTKDQNQKTDWQKMLKFGRKKRDRVDHILVQELHEEEAQWVNYDEDELYVKMQLADSIFDALLKDTADVFTLISDKRAKRDTLS